jgi:hypothetical protein
MSRTTPEQNKALFLEAIDTLFNKRDYDAAERFWSDHDGVGFFPPQQARLVRHRRAEQRPDHPLAQQFLPISRIFTRRGAGLRDARRRGT